MCSPMLPRPPRRAGPSGCTLALLALALLPIAVAFNGWVFMLLQGALASEFGWDTWDYGTAVLVALAVSVVSGILKGGSSR